MVNPINHKQRHELLRHLLMYVSLMFGWCSIAWAADPKLENIDVSTVSGNDVIMKFKLSDKAAQDPRTFSTDNPARIVIDLPGVSNALPSEKARMKLSSGVLEGINVVGVKGRTRVVASLSESVPFEVLNQDGLITLKLSSNFKPEAQHSGKTFIGAADVTAGKDYDIKDLDFRRGKNNAGRFIVDLSVKNAAVDIKEEGHRVVVRFVGANLPKKLARKLDVTDFGTPVKDITIKRVGEDVQAVIQTDGVFENIAYQTDKEFTVEVRPLTEHEKLLKEREKFKYTGERLSLNFQDIEVRAVLQLIADFTKLNLVASDSVTGNVTLRLQNVPWDQALDIILKTKGLDKRQVGNVLLVAPTAEIAAREQLELQASQQVEELAPLRSEFIQVNYATAGDLAALMRDENNSLLSSRGSVSIDARTNTLLVQDTANKISEIRAIVKLLDIPVRQVLIESRIVVATDDFERAMGIDFGLATSARDKPSFGLSGSRASAGNIALGGSPDAESSDDRLNVQLPSGFSDGSVKGTFGMALAQLPGGTMIDLELSALESEGLGTVVSSPRLITSNQTLAYIESGEEIPFQEATSSGATSTSFKKAVLRLEVTPQITPDEKIVLDLKVNQDSKGDQVSSGNFAIDTREISTKILVDNGDTIVLGGVYTQTKNSISKRIPFLGQLPVIGWLFSNDKKENLRSELMIFVTPKIIKEYT